MRSFALASGSSGNCFFLESLKGAKVLVDLGLSFKRTKEILEERGVDILDVDYVFITHEHTDHCQGLKRFVCECKNCKVFLSKGTFEALNLDLDNYEFVCHHDVLSVGDMKVFVLSKPHDSKEALSFVFENGKKVGFFTDLGFVSDEIKYVIKGLDVVYFETSYCDKIISKRDLSYLYVNRLISDLGHLSVDDGKEVLGEVCNSNQKIVLSHVSTNANSYENAYMKVKSFLASLGLFPEIFVSFQDEPSEWIE